MRYPKYIGKEAIIVYCLHDRTRYKFPKFLEIRVAKFALISSVVARFRSLEHFQFAKIYEAVKPADKGPRYRGQKFGYFDNRTIEISN